MSPKIQEWSHKSRSSINNLYLLTRAMSYIIQTEEILLSRVKSIKRLIGVMAFQTKKVLSNFKQVS